jgi:predicted membrane protein
VLSKNFKGGEVVCVFAGSEINLTQADFGNTVKIEVVAIFGGTKLIVPANWEIRAETTTILGGIDDKRDPAGMANATKVVILEGVVICGGIEISSY